MQKMPQRKGIWDLFFLIIKLQNLEWTLTSTNHSVLSTSACSGGYMFFYLPSFSSACPFQCLFCDHFSPPAAALGVGWQQSSRVSQHTLAASCYWTSFDTQTSWMTRRTHGRASKSRWEVPIQGEMHNKLMWRGFFFLLNTGAGIFLHLKHWCWTAQYSTALNLAALDALWFWSECSFSENKSFILQFVLTEDVWLVYCYSNHKLFLTRPSRARAGSPSIDIERLTPKDRTSSGLHDSHGCNVFHPKWNVLKSHQDFGWTLYG